MFLIKKVERPQEKKPKKLVFFAPGKIGQLPTIKFEKSHLLLICPHWPYKTMKSFNFHRHIKAHIRNENTIKNDNLEILNDVNNNTILNNSLPIEEKNECITQNENNYKIIEMKKDCSESKLFLISQNNLFEYTNDNISILKNLFIPNDHLNSQEIDFGNYYVYNNHLINSGTFGNVFFGAHKRSGIRVAIKQIEINYDFSFQVEKDVLVNILSTGNFPEF